MTEQESIRVDDVAALVLAAGKGTRMKSDLPKVLLKAAGQSLLERVLLILQTAGIRRTCLVLGGDLEPFNDLLQRYPDLPVCRQVQRRGTGDAAASAAPGFTGVTPPSWSAGELLRGTPLTSAAILICYGDTPCLQPTVIGDFITTCQREESRIGVLGMRHPNPTGYGRLVLDEEGRLEEIVEEKDADDRIRRIDLCNSGIVYAATDFLFHLLARLTPENAQKEYYLTDCFRLAREEGAPATVYITDDYRSFDGVNDPVQLAAAEELLKETGRAVP